MDDSRRGSRAEDGPSPRSTTRSRPWPRPAPAASRRWAPTFSNTAAGRFARVLAERAPSLYRLLAAELDGQEKAMQALIGIIDLEEQLIGLGTIQPVGFRLVARRRRPD